MQNSEDVGLLGQKPDNVRFDYKILFVKLKKRLVRGGQKTMFTSDMTIEMFNFRVILYINIDWFIENKFYEKKMIPEIR